MRLVWLWLAFIATGPSYWCTKVYLVGGDVQCCRLVTTRLIVINIFINVFSLAVAFVVIF